MPRSPLELSRDQILGFRRRVGALDERLPPGPESLRRAAWAGLQDSMPRAALLSIHARVEGAGPTSWEDPSLVQLWGPRYQVYVIAARDRAVFSLGRLPDEARGRQRAEQHAARLQGLRETATPPTYSEAGRALGLAPNALRYAAATGTVLIRWEGARRPTIWTVPPPEIAPLDARLELVRRYLRVFGPTTSASFARWSSVSARGAAAAFELLAKELTPVQTPLGGAWILAEDEPAFSATSRQPAAVRLLPSGDAYFLLHGAERELLVPDAARRALLWTTRVWPGALLVEGEVAGTWRRSHGALSVRPWGPLSRAAEEAVETEAASLPIPGLEAPATVRWDV